MKKLLQEFKEFALKGNVVSMAIGVLIGGAFQSLVTEFTNDIIAPLIGLIGGLDFSQWTLKLGDVEVLYGSFITAVINFLIMAFIVFMVVKGLNKVMTIGHKKEEDAPAPTTKVCPYCKSEVAIDATRCPHCTSELS
jgi:large conductance mechanosensitive channel